MKEWWCRSRQTVNRAVGRPGNWSGAVNGTMFQVFTGPNGFSARRYNSAALKLRNLGRIS